MLAARWPISADKRKDYLAALHEALVIARKDKKVRAITSCLRAITALEAQNQADEHLEIKNERLDHGKATDGMTIRVVYEDKEVSPDA